MVGAAGDTNRSEKCVCFTLMQTNTRRPMALIIQKRWEGKRKQNKKTSFKAAAVKPTALIEDGS